MNRPAPEHGQLCGTRFAALIIEQKGNKAGIPLRNSIVFIDRKRVLHSYFRFPLLFA